MIGKTILLVDDDQLFLSDWEEYFEFECEMRVLTAHDSTSAHLKFTSKMPPDVAILDVNLGSDEGGIDILRKIRGEDNNTPVIMLSATKDLQYELDCLDIDPKVEWLEKSRYGDVNKPELLKRKVEQLLESIDDKSIELEFNGKALYKFFFADDGSSPTLNDERLKLSGDLIIVLKCLLEYQKDGIKTAEILNKLGKKENEDSINVIQKQISDIRKELNWHCKTKSVIIKKSNTRYYTYIDKNIKA